MGVPAPSPRGWGVCHHLVCLLHPLSVCLVWLPLACLVAPAAFEPVGHLGVSGSGVAARHTVWISPHATIQGGVHQNSFFALSGMVPGLSEVVLACILFV